jgi:hypothetical protein
MKNMNGTISNQFNSLLGERLVVQITLGEVGSVCDGVKILYGETYDKYGITIDSIKYYIFLEYLARLLGKDSQCIVVEGDLHSVINPLVTEKEFLLIEAKRRVGQIEKIFNKLSIKQVTVRLMSELFDEPKVIDLVNTVSTLIKDRIDLQDKLAPTVLKNRITQERESGFQYAAEAIGLALNFNLKVGPPRERNYDLISREIAKELGVDGYSSIYLRPSYPFTTDFSYYLTHPEIEEYGLTPYKAGSNKLQDQRIILGVTSEQMIRNLIINAFIPLDIADANPIVDLASIVVIKEQIKQDKIDILDLDKQIKILVINREQLVSKVIELIREIA